MNARLALLGARRSAPPALVVFGVLLLIGLSLVDWSPHADLVRLAAWTGAGDPARAQTRAGVWTAAALVLLPLFCARVAATVPSWRRRDVDWLASSAAGRGTATLSTLVGIAGAALVLCLGAAAITEAAARCSGPAGDSSWNFGGRLETPGDPLVEGRDGLRWTVPTGGELPADGRLRVALVLLRGEPMGTVRFEARRANGAATEAARRLPGAGSISVAIPEGSGELELRVSFEEDGVRAAISGEGLTWLSPGGSAAIGGASVALQAWLATCAFAALALGLGAWVSSTTAALFSLAVAAAVWLAEDAPAFLPLASLPVDLARMTEGVTPAMPGVSTWFGALGLMALGFALCAWCPSTLRRAP